MVTSVNVFRQPSIPLWSQSDDHCYQKNKVFQGSNLFFWVKLRDGGDGGEGGGTNNYFTPPLRIYN